MENEAFNVEPERPALTIVEGTAKAPEPLAANEDKGTHRKKRANRRNTPDISKPYADLVARNADAGRSDGSVLPTAIELEADKRALNQFRALLQELVSGTNDGSAKKGHPPKLTRNPFVKLKRYLEQEPGFEELVGKYASLLPLLEQPSGLMYSEMSLIGIKALRARRLGISKTVYEEVRYRTSVSAALVSVMKGVVFFIIGLAIVSIVLPVASFAILRWSDVPTQAITSFLNLPNVKHIGVAVLFGCLGSVVSLLLRLAEFEGTRGRSKAFLVLYGSTLPIVGGTFAAVLAVILDAQIINLGVSSNQIYVVIGFLSGFSERFTRNILNMAEYRFSPQGRDAISK